MTDLLHIAICVCTYRRPKGLEAALSGIAAQRFAGVRPRLGVVVVDNEGSEKTRSICDEFNNRHDLNITYVHEARRGISQARNAGLDNLPDDADFVAMIDDDEVPAPDWLDRLLSAQRQTDADVVHGPVAPVFPDGAPSWIVDGRFFGWPRSRFGREPSERPHLGELRTAATNNVLVRLALVRRLRARFDPSLGLTSAEDPVFFDDLHHAGARIVWSSDAWVSETIPAERARFSYLWRQAFRIGNQKLLLGLRSDRRSDKSKHVIRARLHILKRSSRFLTRGTLWCVRALFTTRPRIGGFASGGLQVGCGLGMLASVVGFRYRHYLNPTGDATAQDPRTEPESEPT